MTGFSVTGLGATGLGATGFGTTVLGLRTSLAERETEALELMDDPACDEVLLARTYAQSRVVNALVAGWRTIYRRRIRPLLSADRTTSLLDVGSGGGDVPRALARWAGRDGLRLEVTAVDPDPRAHAFATDPARATPRDGRDRVRFRRATSTELVAAGERFDVVTSNHVLHHLDPPALATLLADSARLARVLVVHDDIARSRFAYAAYGLATSPWSGRSFVHHDGLLSIRRSYRRAELVAAVPPSWRVVPMLPSRLLLLHEPPSSGEGTSGA